MFGESPGPPWRRAYSRIKLSATLRTAFLSAKDAKNAKRAKAHRLDVLLAWPSFAFFASFAEKFLLSITCVMFSESPLRPRVIGGFEKARGQSLLSPNMI